jgi:peroxiredoxin
VTVSSASIAEQSQELSAASASRLPADVTEVFARSLADLTANGVPASVAGVGTLVPDASLLDASGATTSLFAATGERPAVLVFYRGAWCPYCNIALKTYGEHLLAPLTDRGISLVAISPQTPDGSLSMQEKHDLQFPVMSDPGNTIADRLGILMGARSTELRSVQEGLGLSLEKINADGTETIPFPTVILLDHEHTIRWIDVHPNFTTRTEVADIIAAADSRLT